MSAVQHQAHVAVCRALCGVMQSEAACAKPEQDQSQHSTSMGTLKKRAEGAEPPTFLVPLQRLHCSGEGSPGDDFVLGELPLHHQPAASRVCQALPLRL